LDVVASGLVSHAAVAAELKRREIEAPRGGCWYPTGVARHLFHSGVPEINAQRRFRSAITWSIPYAAARQPEGDGMRSTRRHILRWTGSL